MKKGKKKKKMKKKNNSKKNRSQKKFSTICLGELINHGISFVKL